MDLKSQRKSNFHKLKTHPFYANLFKKLRVSDYQFAERFFEQYGNLDSNEYAKAVQRAFIDDKPSKNWTTLNELLLVSK